MKRVQLKPKTLVEPEEQVPDALTVYVNKHWRMCWDGLQFQMQERVVYKEGKRVGEVVWMRRGYFRHLDYAIDWLIRNEVYAQPVNIDMRALADLFAGFNKLRAECKIASDKIEAVLAPPPTLKTRAKPEEELIVIPAEPVVARVRRKVKVEPFKGKINKHGMPTFLERKAPKVDPYLAGITAKLKKK